MSREYDNTNRGVLFRNEKKEEGSNQPDYTGSLNVGGTDYFLDAWIKTARESGKKFMSVSVKQKRGRGPQRANSSGGGNSPY